MRLPVRDAMARRDGVDLMADAGSEYARSTNGGPRTASKGPPDQDDFKGVMMAASKRTRHHPSHASQQDGVDS